MNRSNFLSYKRQFVRATREVVTLLQPREWSPYYSQGARGLSLGRLRISSIKSVGSLPDPPIRETFTFGEFTIFAQP